MLHKVVQTVQSVDKISAVLCALQVSYVSGNLREISMFQVILQFSACTEFSSSSEIFGSKI